MIPSVVFAFWRVGSILCRSSSTTTETCQLSKPLVAEAGRYSSTGEDVSKMTFRCYYFDSSWLITRNNTSMLHLPLNCEHSKAQLLFYNTLCATSTMSIHLHLKFVKVHVAEMSICAMSTRRLLSELDLWAAGGFSTRDFTKLQT